MMGDKPTGHVKHVYEPTETGCTFYAETKVGKESGGFINRLIPHFYTKKNGMQWIHHNIQETGNLQNIAPILYANQDKVFFDPDFIKFD